MKNPLLIPFSLPQFSKIKPNHVLPAITKVLTDCRKAVEEVIKKDKLYTWENLCQPLDEANNFLECVFSPISHLNSVKNSSELRSSYEKALLLLSEYNNWISHHSELYKAYCNLRNNQNYDLLNTEQKKVISNILQNFELSGIKLTKEKRLQYSKITSRLSELSNHYNNNVLDATMGWEKLILDKKDLIGIPESAIEIAKAKAEEKGEKGWLLTLDASSYLSVITYCNNPDLRKEIYRAYNTRASDQDPNANKWDNGPIMNEILQLRHELANLLGFQTYAHKSLSTKMADTPQQVLEFLDNLIKYAYRKGKKEFRELSIFAKTKYNAKTLQPWDIAWYSEKQKQYLYGINDELFRPYFPENKVLNGLFEIVKRIYGINVKEKNNVDVWHPDVRFFEIYDENNELFGSFYLDLYIRENKRSGAWMDNCMSKIRKADGSLQKPVAYLTCNFNPPINDKPSLLTHNDVVTLFHEFGHGLHHILTRIETIGVSGINGVPWDAIELPSQFMENWCWESNSLDLISSHYKTGQPLPRVFLKKILTLKKYQSSLFLLRQLELALFDFRLHIEFNPEQKTKIYEILSEIKNQISFIPNPVWMRFQNTFSHIFSGGYAAGYYSYLWAHVLSADAFSRFKKEGIFNRETGQSFLENILSCGGSEKPIDLFKRFLGREPKIDSMLKHYGIKD